MAAGVASNGMVRLGPRRVGQGSAVCLYAGASKGDGVGWAGLAMGAQWRCVAEQEVATSNGGRLSGI